MTRCGAFCVLAVFFVSFSSDRTPGGGDMRASVLHLRKDGPVPADQQWTVYIYPHSHVDIGYTADQETVKQLHIRNIDVAIDIARKTANYPAGSRFVWNPEATWVISSYLEQATPAQRDTLFAAIKRGWIRVDAAHSNMNTSLASDEELYRSFDTGRMIGELTGKPPVTMVQMDVAGAAWGLVPVAAAHGVKGILTFPNYFDLRDVLENKPFYWLAPDGKTKVFYLQATSYGWGFRLKGRHYGLARAQSFNNGEDRLRTSDPLENFIDPFIFEQLGKLEAEGSPYRIFAMTWSMADNCLIDADLPEAVRLWNEKYASPRLVIAGAEEIVNAYETRYKDIIPERRGDLTEFWTEGPSSDARSLADARYAKEALVQAETAAILLAKADDKRAPQAWEDLFLALEHTWGFQDPRSPRAETVEATKAGYFSGAKALADSLLQDNFGSLNDKPAADITVLNTLGWARTGLITIPAGKLAAPVILTDDRGAELISQRLSTGETVFQTTLVPAYGSAVYHVKTGNPTRRTSLPASVSTLNNGVISVKVDTKTGDIAGLEDLASNYEYVRNGLNSFYYVPGVYNGRTYAGEPERPGAAAVVVKEEGPLVSSLLVSSPAPGCTSLRREVRLVKGCAYVDIVNTIVKPATLAKEGMHFGFDFNIPGAVTSIDVPWAVMQPEHDQLPGANRNWLAFQRWVSMANAQHGITWTCREAPLIEYGSISGTILDGARQADRWISSLNASQTLYSWVLNNHWDTNFPLQQGGTFTFTYRILLHGAYDAGISNRFGVDFNRPLLAAWGVKHTLRKLPATDNANVFITPLAGEKPGRTDVRIRSLSADTETVSFRTPAGSKKITVPPYGLLTIDGSKENFEK